MRMMKLLCVALATACLIGCAHTSNPLVGSWRLVSSAGEAVSAEGDAGATLKILNDTHFAFGVMASENRVFSGGGRYEYSEGAFTEIVEYHNLPYLVGRRLTFRCELKENLWYHSGSFDVGGRAFDVKEVWRRVARETARARAENVAKARHRR